MYVALFIINAATLTICVYTFRRLYIISKELARIRGGLEFQMELFQYTSDSERAVRHELYPLPHVSDQYRN